jgi:hypothetical protein
MAPSLRGDVWSGPSPEGPQCSTMEPALQGMQSRPGARTSAGGVMTELRRIRSIEPLVTRVELAELLGCSEDTIDEMRRAGMPWIRWGSRLVRFEATAAVAWLKAHGSEAA